MLKKIGWRLKKTTADGWNLVKYMKEKQPLTTTEEKQGRAWEQMKLVLKGKNKLCWAF